MGRCANWSKRRQKECDKDVGRGLSRRRGVIAFQIAAWASPTSLGSFFTYFFFAEFCTYVFLKLLFPFVSWDFGDGVDLQLSSRREFLKDAP